MHLIEIRFRHSAVKMPDEFVDSVNSLLGAWRNNGQICGREFPLVTIPGALMSRLMTPAIDSLQSTNDSGYARRYREQITVGGAGSVEVVVLGEEVESAPVCACSMRSGLILFTTYVSLETPVRCGDCFGVVPLYTLSPTPGGDHNDVIGWQSDYENCDRLQMNCRVLVRQSTKQLAGVASALTVQGRGLCSRLEEAVGLPVYYYLYRDEGLDSDSEAARKCPGCGGGWEIPRLWNKFDFRCGACRLLSNLAWNFQ